MSDINLTHQIRLFKNCFKLLTFYYIRGFFMSFYLIFFPLIILIIQKLIFENSDRDPSKLSSIFLGTLISQIIIIGFYIIPNTIIDFRNSIIIKHFGSMNMKPKTFFLSVICFGFILSILTVLVTIIWTILLFINHSVKNNILLAINAIWLVYLFLLIVIAITFGVFLATFIKTNKQHTLIANMLFLPMILLSGAYLPIKLIEQNFITNFLSYISIFKYPSILLLDLTDKQPILSNEILFYTYLIISFLLPIFFILISVRWWKWYD